MFQGYLAIPVFRYPRDRDENPIAYLGRWPGEDFDDADRPRYKFPADFPKSRFLYGLNEALADTKEDEPLILVEGCFSVFRLMQADIPGAVASFGASLSDAQAALLLASGRSVILMYDGDEAGYAGMRKAAGKLITGTLVRAIKLPDGRQPDDLSDDELRSLLRR